MVSRGGNCRRSSRQPGRCRRSSPAGPAAGRGSASSTRRATDCGCGPGGTGTDRRDHRPQTVPAADTVPRSGRGRDGGTRTNGVKRRLAVEVNGLLLTVVVTAASIPDRDAAHRLLAALRGSLSTIGLVWADGGYPGRLLIWAKDVLTLTMQIIKRLPGATGFHVRPRIWVVKVSRGSTSTAAARALRNQTRPPRSHGPPRHDHDHDQATRPNLTVFKHPLN